MRSYSLSHVGDTDLLRDLALLVAHERRATARVLAHIAEVDARRLFLPAACASMREYCVRVLGLSDDAADKRIQVARQARELPALFDALARGRVHLSGLNLPAPYVNPPRATGRRGSRPDRPRRARGLPIPDRARDARSDPPRPPLSDEERARGLEQVRRAIAEIDARLAEIDRPPDASS